MRDPAAFPDESCRRVEFAETHISWVFLTERHAYKVKKPIRNPFLDYSTLEKRRHFCSEELRLDRRYAPQLYLDVVGIHRDGDRLSVGGSGPVVEYAVKMVRFPEDAVLSVQLEQGRVALADIEALAEHIAEFHHSATQAELGSPFGEPRQVLQDALDNFDALADMLNFADEENADSLSSGSNLPPADEARRAQLQSLRVWTEDAFANSREIFQLRKQMGFVRECHGDLHAGNIVRWNGALIPFDGIEFNEGFRWIDVLSDICFLVMDLRSRGRPDLSAALINAYLERTGDYEQVALLRWYELYRCMVRAKVAGIRLGQCRPQSAQHAQAQQKLAHLIRLGGQITKVSPPTLWITHGLSGSGKSTGSMRYVQREQAIRIRSDVERKRLLEKSADYRPDSSEIKRFYSPEITAATYERLEKLAGSILRAGYSAVVDATFLRRGQRRQFVELASRVGVPIRILDFRADIGTLRMRLVERARTGRDPSDADISVLEKQQAHAEPLDGEELRLAVPVETFQC
jgi:uncharacterized protein